MILKYLISHPGEPEAGIASMDDVVTITVESGAPGGKAREFEVFMRRALSVWYEGASVRILPDETTGDGT